MTIGGEVIKKEHFRGHALIWVEFEEVFEPEPDVETKGGKDEP